MTFLIGILAVVFLILTFMVVSKTKSLIGGVTNDSDQNDAGVDGSNNVNAIALFIFWIVSVIGVVWSFNASKENFLPEASSVHGRETDFWFWVSIAVITTAFFIVNSLLFFFAYKYRYQKGKVATFYPHNNRLEVIWTVIPAIVMAGLVFTGLRVWNNVMDDAPANAEEIEIMGKQFGWEVRYPGVDNNKLGRYDFRLIDDATQNVQGIDFTDENSFDDFTTSTELHIPKGKPVLLKIRARDVLHSVFIPHMRVKMDAVPGMPTKFWFVADKSTNDMRKELGNAEFDYEIACAEVCGRSHFAMKLKLVVDEEADYIKWKKDQKPFLTQNPGFIEKVPASLKAKAMKYLPVEEATTAQVTTDTTVAVGAATSSMLK